MNAIVAILMKDGKMSYLKGNNIADKKEDATLFDDWKDAQAAMNEHSLYRTKYPLAWFILVEQEKKEWAIKHHIICESDYSY